MPAPRQNACRPGVFSYDGGEDAGARGRGRRGLLQGHLLLGGGLGKARDAACDGFGVHVEFRSRRGLLGNILGLVERTRARRNRLAKGVDGLEFVARDIVAGFEQILQAQ